MSDYGIPYMGSKAKIAASIAMNFPKATNFYDLFGGGFSISHYMLEHKRNRFSRFHYNEIKSDIVDLVKSAINGDFNYNKFKPLWVSRDDFAKQRDNSAYVRCLWSFGNNQKGYLFSQEIEQYKKSMHMAVVFDEFDSLSKEVLGFDKWPSIATTIKQKRFYLIQKIEHYRVTKIPNVLHQFLNEKQLQRLQQLQQLQQLQRLERLQQLQQLQRLSFSSKDYREVEILPDSVVYCDIPYQGTSDYGVFNHKEFFDWAATRDFPVYISEYHIADKRFKLIYDIDKIPLLNTNKIVKVKSEKLYWNQK
jgi:hypothetical protein